MILRYMSWRQIAGLCVPPVWHILWLAAFGPPRTDDGVRVESVTTDDDGNVTLYIRRYGLLHEEGPFFLPKSVARKSFPAAG